MKIGLKQKPSQPNAAKLVEHPIPQGVFDAPNSAGVLAGTKKRCKLFLVGAEKVLFACVLIALSKLIEAGSAKQEIQRIRVHIRKGQNILCCILKGSGAGHEQGLSGFLEWKGGFSRSKAYAFFKTGRLSSGKSCHSSQFVDIQFLLFCDTISLSYCQIFVNWGDWADLATICNSYHKTTVFEMKTVVFGIRVDTQWDYLPCRSCISVAAVLQ